MKNKEYFKNHRPSFVEEYETQAMCSAIVWLMGGGRLLIRKPDDIKAMPENVTDLPEGMTFTGGGGVSVPNIYDGTSRYPFVYLYALNNRLLDTLGAGLVVEGNWVKLWDKDKYHNSPHYVRYAYLYPRMVDACYMQMIQDGLKLTASITNVGTPAITNGVVTHLSYSDELCVIFGGDTDPIKIKVNDLIECAKWTGDVFNYDLETKVVSISVPKEETEEEEEEEEDE